MIEKTILSALISNEEYARKVVPHLKVEYFSEAATKAAFKIIQYYFNKYGKIPSKSALLVEIEGREFNNELYKSLIELIRSLEPQVYDLEWLLDKTEEWCKERSLFLAIYRSIDVLEGKDKKLQKSALPDLFREALSVSFDTHVGHDFLEDAEQRYEEYHKVEKKIQTNLRWLNEITGGGTPPKTLSVIIAGTGMGKSQFLCNLAATNLLDNLNVLYITLEMSEVSIAQRIESHILDKPFEVVKSMKKDEYLSIIQQKFLNVKGKLIIKEYPTGYGHVGHFRYLIKELEQKKNFRPDVIYVDYMGICASSRYNSGNMYEHGKAVAEELRGLAVEFDVPVWSASQLNREGMDSTEITLTNIAESMGITHTADLIIGLTSNEDLLQRNQVVLKQLKNRIGDVNVKKKCIVGIDFSRSRFYDVLGEVEEKENFNLNDVTVVPFN